jgi:hypothetical protein
MNWLEADASCIATAGSLMQHITASFVLIAAAAMGAVAVQVLASDAPALQRFIIERQIPGAYKMTRAELRDAAAKSNRVLRSLGPDVQWVESYVAGDKFYCIYNARSADLIKRHAELAGFPANRITAVATVIDPTTAKDPPAVRTP